MNVKKLTIKELKDEAKYLDEAINVCCYGKRDIMLLDKILVELKNRGVKFNKVLKFNEDINLCEVCGDPAEDFRTTCMSCDEKDNQLKNNNEK